MTYSDSDYRIIKASKFFDADWYRKQYPEVDENNYDPVVHYLILGWSSGKNPGPNFDGIKYSMANPAVSEQHINPLLHYEKIGKFIKSRVNYEDGISVKLYDIEFKENKVVIATSSNSACFYHILVNGTEIYPVSELEYHQECFDSYLNANGESLRIFNLDYEQIKSDIMFISDDNICKVTLTIQNFVNMYQNTKLGYYVITEGNVLTITNKDAFIAYAYKSTEGLLQERSLLEKVSAPKEKKYNLYVETLDNHNDNAFQMFLCDLKNNKNAYFVTSRINYNHETNEELKAHYLILNSNEFKEYMLEAKRIVVSWWCFPVYGYDRSKLLYPFLNYDFWFVPHGISYDKNSYYLHYYNFGRVKKIFCCSEYEKQYFINCIGCSNTEVLGYPRMDKWSNVEINNNMVLLFPTWRKEVGDTYINEILKITKALTEKKPEITIIYAAHPSINADAYEQILGQLKNISESVICLNSLDNDLFNKYFAMAKYLITDYSSVAYDFSYKSDGYAIYYKPLAQIDNHYELKKEFYEANCGITVNNIDELLSTVSGNFDKKFYNGRKKKFFRFNDECNTERVMNYIKGAENNE